MCLAIYKPSKQNFPSRDLLYNAWKTNPDGAGLAIARKSGVEIIKGIMTFTALMKVLDNDELFNEEIVLHFRYSTSGTVIPELTHPFPVTLKNEDFRKLNFITEKAIIHNGVLFSPLTNDYSDTAIFSRYMALKPNISKAKLEKIIKQDRLAIVTNNKVKLLGNWTNIDGVFYSNTYSLYPSKIDIFDEKVLALSSRYDDYSSDNCASMEYCPFCDSDQVEYIGVKTHTFECIDCQTVFNETEMLLDSWYKTKPIKAKVGIR